MQKILLTATLLVAFHLVWAQGRLTVQGDSLISLGQSRIQLSKQGFPEQIDNLLAENIHFHFTRQSDGKDIRLTSGGLQFTRRNAKKVEWNAVSTSDELQMEVSASLQADGHLMYKVTVTAQQDLDLKDITVHIPLQPERAKFMKGLGWSGGPVSAWIGTADGGLQYNFGSVAGDKGGVIVVIKGKSMLVNNYSGPRHLQKGGSLSYSFGLLATGNNK